MNRQINAVTNGAPDGHQYRRTMSRGIAVLGLAFITLFSFVGVQAATQQVAGAAPVGATVNWNDATPSNPADSPAARDGASMATEPNGNVILFGGYAPNGSSHFDDTWIWDGSTWTDVTPVNSPPARAFAPMVYDSTNGNVVLFGGNGDSGHLNDTWIWDGTTWTEAVPVNSPPTRDRAVMADDSTNGNVVLFGGLDDTASPMGDTWTWDGTNWTDAAPATSPSARSDASMTEDSSASNNVVLFGGQDAGGIVGDTWTWDGTTWTDAAPATSPTARSVAALSYDSTRNKVVLFGGYDASGAASGPSLIYMK